MLTHGMSVRVNRLEAEIDVLMEGINRVSDREVLRRFGEIEKREVEIEGIYRNHARKEAPELELVLRLAAIRKLLMEV